MQQSLSWKVSKSSASHEIPAICENQRFITALITALYLHLSWARAIKYMTKYRILWTYILILYFHLRLGIPSDLFLSHLPTKTPYQLSSPPQVLHAPPISFFSFWLSVSNADQTALRYVVFSTPMLPRPS